jgi:hypothetical protein
LYFSFVEQDTNLFCECEGACFQITGEGGKDGRGKGAEHNTGRTCKLENFIITNLRTTLPHTLKAHSKPNTIPTKLRRHIHQRKPVPQSKHYIKPLLKLLKNHRPSELIWRLSFLQPASFSYIFPFHRNDLPDA